MTSATMEQHDLELDEINPRLADAGADEVIRWAVDTFGQRLVMSSSFGVQAAVMLHLVTRVVPDIPVVLIDTGYLFPETYQFAETLTKRLKLNIKVYRPELSAAHYEALYGPQWDDGPQGLALYNYRHKVEPMKRALEELSASAWLAGLRSEQTDHRATLKKVEIQDKRYKIHPILNWTTKDVHEYLKKHDLPYHPLYEKGYMSIGDTHSTVPITQDMHDRAGRFHGLKQECGLHLPTSAEENESRGSSGL